MNTWVCTVRYNCVIRWQSHTWLLLWWCLPYEEALYQMSGPLPFTFTNNSAQGSNVATIQTLSCCWPSFLDFWSTNLEQSTRRRLLSTTSANFFVVDWKHLFQLFNLIFILWLALLSAELVVLFCYSCHWNSLRSVVCVVTTVQTTEAHMHEHTTVTHGKGDLCLVLSPLPCVPKNCTFL